MCKGLYSNVLGLLGGINCAILVAFVCQKYPLKDPAVVLEKFFRIMEVWEWRNPIMLRQPSADDARAGNPRYCAVSFDVGRCRGDGVGGEPSPRWRRARAMTRDTQA